MLTFDIDTLEEKIPNKFHLVLCIVDRVRALKKGIEPKVERKGRDLITVAIEELEGKDVEFLLQDSYVSPTVEMLEEKERRRKQGKERMSSASAF